MEFLQWMNASLRTALAGAFALLPGTVIWLSLLAAWTFFRKERRGRILRAFRARTRPA